MTAPAPAPAPATSYLNTAFNAVTRMPVIFAGMNATLLGGEVAMRVIGTGLSFVGFNGDNKLVATVSKQLPEVTFNLMRPFQRLSERQLGISFVACAVISTIGWEICNKLIGFAPKTYNDVAEYMGPIQLNTTWRHPVIEAAVNWWSGSVGQ